MVRVRVRVRVRVGVRVRTPATLTLTLTLTRRGVRASWRRAGLTPPRWFVQNVAPAAVVARPGSEIWGDVGRYAEM